MKHPEYSTIDRWRHRLDETRSSVEKSSGFGGDYVLVKGPYDAPEPFVFSRSTATWTEDFSDAFVVHPAFEASFLGAHVMPLEDARKLIMTSLSERAKVLEHLVSPYWSSSEDDDETKEPRT